MERVGQLVMTIMKFLEGLSTEMKIIYIRVLQKNLACQRVSVLHIVCELDQGTSSSEWRRRLTKSDRSEAIIRDGFRFILPPNEPLQIPITLMHIYHAVHFLDVADEHKWM